MKDAVSNKLGEGRGVGNDGLGVALITIAKSKVEDAPFQRPEENGWKSFRTKAKG